MCSHFSPIFQTKVLLSSRGLNILLPNVTIFIIYTSIVPGLILTTFEQENG